MEKDHKFYEFMEGYVRFLEEMADGESEKYAAMLSYDARRMDRAIASQQAMNMRLTQLENQRQAEQCEAGFAEFSFQQILDRLDGEERELFFDLFRRFARAVDEVKFFNGKSMAFAREGLRTVGTAESAPQGGAYAAGGKRPEGLQSTAIFEAKV